MGWSTVQRLVPAPRHLRLAAFAIGGTILALTLAARVHARIGPFDTTVTARPSFHGQSVVRLAPLGSIELDTHTGPVALEIRVDELRSDDAEAIARDPSLLADLEDELVADARDALVGIVVRTMVVGMIGGALGALLGRARWRALVTGLGVGGILTGTVASIAALTFDPGAVAEPRYSGLLTVAPKAVGDVESLVERFDDYRAQLTELVGNVVTLYRAAEALPSLDPGDDTVRVLHVSDIHNNPQAFDLIEQLASQFDVDAVFDTGDMTDWGTIPESGLPARITELDVPYVWVRGNHDSRQTQEAIAAIDNAVVLDGDAANVAGLRVWGIGDPRYTPDQADDAAEGDRAGAFAPTVADAITDDGAQSVDVVLVHDQRIAAELGDLVPLVLAGHRHSPSQGSIGDAVLLVEGSTGGAGLRGLQGDEPHPLAASVLYFDPATDRLVAYDRISVDGLGGTGARIERHVVDHA